MQYHQNVFNESGFWFAKTEENGLQHECKNYLYKTQE